MIFTILFFVLLFVVFVWLTVIIVRHQMINSDFKKFSNDIKKTNSDYAKKFMDCLDTNLSTTIKFASLQAMCSGIKELDSSDNYDQVKDVCHKYQSDQFKNVYNCAKSIIPPTPKK